MCRSLPACVCVAAGSGQLTALAECDLLDGLDWAEPHIQLQSVRVCVGGQKMRARGEKRKRGRKGGGERERHVGLPVCQQQQHLELESGAEQLRKKNPDRAFRVGLLGWRSGCCAWTDHHLWLDQRGSLLDEKTPPDREPGRNWRPQR